MQNILAAMDFSTITDTVLDRAALLARALNAHLWLIHVASPEPDFVGYQAGPQVVRDQVAEHLREEHRELQRMAAELRDDGVDATALLVRGPTVATILREAEKLAVDLIVLGSHGHGAVHRALLGSTSSGVLDKSCVPVLVIPMRAAES